MSPELQQMPPQPPPRRPPAPRLILGVFLVILGLIYALGEADILDADRITRFWPVVLIVFGLSMVGRGGGSVISGGVIALIGTWLLLNTLNIVHRDLGGFIWPLILVVIGGRIISRAGRSDLPPPPPPPPPPGSTLGEGFTAAPPFGSAPSPGPAPSGTPPLSPHVSMFGMMGGTRQRVGGAVYRSGDLTSFMGSCELDLRDALMGADGVAYVEVFAVMGGAAIFVPPNWKVVVQAMPIMGSVNDKTRSIAGTQPQFLYVRGTVVMGGVEISN